MNAPILSTHEYVSIYFCCLLPNPTQCTSLPTAAVHGQSEVGDGSGSSEGPGATRSDRNVVRGGLKLHHHAANWVFDHPFHILVGASLPVVGSIYYGQSDLKHLKLSQKVMHTRVMGQLSVLSILLGVMFFREHMKLHGRYLEEGGGKRKWRRVQQKVEAKMLKRDEEKHEEDCEGRKSKDDDEGEEEEEEAEHEE